MRALKLSSALACGMSAVVQAAIPEIEGYTITWSDDFDGGAGSPPSSDNWIIDTGTSYPGGPPNWGTGEKQTYTGDPANLQLTGNSELSITAIKDDAGGWTSARIETSRSDFDPGEGGRLRVQASISMPAVSGDQAVGYWPAFWALGSEFRGNYQNWPGIGEFDVMENVNGINSVWAVLHCDVSPGGACNEPDGIGTSVECPGSACQGNYHTYAMVIDRSASPEALHWFVDDQEYHSVSEDEVGADVWGAAIGGPIFALLNLAMGGGFPDGVYGGATPIDATISGESMLVDYVAVYNG